jgi:hypothetical protein
MQGNPELIAYVKAGLEHSNFLYAMPEKERYDYAISDKSENTVARYFDAKILMAHHREDVNPVRDKIIVNLKDFINDVCCRFYHHIDAQPAKTGSSLRVLYAEANYYLAQIIPAEKEKYLRESAKMSSLYGVIEYVDILIHENDPPNVDEARKLIQKCENKGVQAEALLWLTKTRVLIDKIYSDKLDRASIAKLRIDLSWIRPMPVAKRAGLHDGPPDAHDPKRIKINALSGANYFKHIVTLSNSIGSFKKEYMDQIKSAITEETLNGNKRMHRTWGVQKHTGISLENLKAVVLDIQKEMISWGFTIDLAFDDRSGGDHLTQIQWVILW